jgi:hypothetical protein
MRLAAYITLVLPIVICDLLIDSSAVQTWERGNFLKLRKVSACILCNACSRHRYAAGKQFRA